LCSFFRRPFARRLSLAIRLWVERGQPVLPEPFFPDVFTEVDLPNFPFVTSEEQARESLTRSRVFRLLQLRNTSGSVHDMFPPSQAELISCFRSPHRKGKRELELTVGGRALSKVPFFCFFFCFLQVVFSFLKHAVRSSWWSDQTGNAKGSAAAMNAKAVKVISRLLNEAVWQNLHSLPPDRIVAFEIRIAEGYGARWTADRDGKWSFRGYLEPPSLSGHETGWKH
jgi:hypothetical protein